MDTAHAITEMQTNPDNFFKYYPLNVAGPAGAHAAGAATLKTAHFTKRDPGITAHTVDNKEGHYGATRPGPFGFGTRNLSSFRVLGYPAAGSTPLNVYSVPMVDYNGNGGGVFDMGGNPANMPSYHLGGAGDGLMFTGQLTGCTFCWQVDGAALRLCHVQPTGAPNGTILQNTLALHGRFAGGPNLPVGTFGQNDYPVSANVVGVRVGGVWRLYAQNSPNGGLTVTGAWQLHPGAKRQL